MKKYFDTICDRNTTELVDKQMTNTIIKSSEFKCHVVFTILTKENYVYGNLLTM